MAAVTEAVVEVMDQAVVEAVTIHPVVAVVEEVKYIFFILNSLFIRRLWRQWKSRGLRSR